jgi:hypothetical protein
MTTNPANHSSKVSAFAEQLSLSGFGFLLSIFFALSDLSLTTPETILSISLLMIHYFRKYVPKRDDTYLEMIKQLQQENVGLRTDISKLNLVFGINQQREEAKRKWNDPWGDDISRPPEGRKAVAK